MNHSLEVLVHGCLHTLHEENSELLHETISRLRCDWGEVKNFSTPQRLWPFSIVEFCFDWFVGEKFSATRMRSNVYFPRESIPLEILRANAEHSWSSS